MNIIKKTTEGKQAVLYTAVAENRPLVVINHYSSDTDRVIESLRDINSRNEIENNLLFVYDLDWEHDMTPWECPPLYPSGKACTGGADEYLEILLAKIIPDAKESLLGVPGYTAVAGYSLAGLFAIYSLYNCDVFDRAASISGSMWFPGFTDYVFSHKMKKKPERIYLSLGDKERKTKNPLLRKVQDNTEAIAGYFEDEGIPVVWELNPGNHFADASARFARGIDLLTRCEICTKC